jgi:hypothetical protein
MRLMCGNIAEPKPFEILQEESYVQLLLEVAESNGLKATAWFKALESCLGRTSARSPKASRVYLCDGGPRAYDNSYRGDVYGQVDS